MQSKPQSSVLIFFLLVLVLFMPFLVLGNIYPIELLPGLPISALGAFTPALAALILGYKSDRLAGILQLLQRSFDLKRIKSPAWFLLIVLINPAIALLAYAWMRVDNISLAHPTLWTLAIIPLFIVFFIAALGEEIGWTGYATEPLLQRWGTLSGSLLLGAVWAAVHFIPLRQAHRSVEWIAWWSLDTIALRMIMMWLYAHSGRSLFAATVFHALINLSWQLFPNQGSHYDPRIFALITLSIAILMYATQWFPSTRSSVWLSTLQHNKPQ
jgi:membrane protease YdiL (CAAX protease family)